MKNWLLLVMVLLGVLHNVNAQQPSHDWLTSLDIPVMSEQCWVRDVDTDEYGNSYITGDFGHDTLLIANNIIIRPAGVLSCLIIIKFNPLGQMVWARTNSTGSLSGLQIAVDHDQNVYVCGTGTNFGSATIDTVQLTQGNIFLVKLDSTGNAIWGTTNTTGGIGILSDIEVDTDQNLIITGWFSSSSSITFNGYSVNCPSTTSTSNMFLFKFDISGNVIFGQYASTSGINNNYGYTPPRALAVDSLNNIFVAGNFSGNILSVSGSPIILTHNPIYGTNPNGYLLKFDPVGNLMWGRKITGSGTDGTDITGLACDNSGNAIILGLFSNSTLQLGNTTISNTSFNWGADFYITKYDPSGNIIWLKGCQNFEEEGYKIRTDQFDNIYFHTGNAGAYDTSSVPIVCPYDCLIKLNPQGNFQWAIDLTSTYHMYPKASIAVTPFGEIYQAGTYHHNINYNGIPYSALSFSRNGYVAKISQMSTGIPEQDDLGSFIYPNPTNGSITIRFQNPSNSLEILDQLGKTIYISNFEKTDEFKISLPHAGLFFIRITSQEKVNVKKVIRY